MRPRLKARCLQTLRHDRLVCRQLRLETRICRGRHAPRPIHSLLDRDLTLILILTLARLPRGRRGVSPGSALPPPPVKKHHHGDRNQRHHSPHRSHSNPSLGPDRERSPTTGRHPRRRCSSRSRSSSSSRRPASGRGGSDPCPGARRRGSPRSRRVGGGGDLVAADPGDGTADGGRQARVAKQGLLADEQGRLAGAVARGEALGGRVGVRRHRAARPGPLVGRLVDGAAPYEAYPLLVGEVVRLPGARGVGVLRVGAAG